LVEEGLDGADWEGPQRSQHTREIG
jgi:hypothetical protein